jgi:uncharacterized membrane protein YkvA (DUF1232 family)
MQDPFSLQLLNPIHLFRILLHLPDFLKLYYRLFLDSRVPLYLKVLFIGGLLYIISPVDFLPDFLLPIIGGFDDIIVLILVGKIFLSCSPRPVVLEHVARIDREGQLKKCS